MTTRTRLLLRLLILIALLPLFLWTAITTLLPVYLEKSLLPALAAKAGIDNLKTRSLSIGMTESVAGFTIGSDKSPAVAVASLTLRYNPMALLAGQVEEVSLSGVEIQAVMTDQGMSIDDPNLQQLFAKPSPDKESSGTKEDMQLPVAIKRVSIRQSALIFHMTDRMIRLPFAAEADLTRVGTEDGPLLVHLQLFPNEQEIALTADLDLNQAKAHLTFSAGNLSPQQFAGLIDLPAGVKLDARADFSGSADLGLSPFILSDVKAQLYLLDSAVHFHGISLAPENLPQQETPPITITISGSQQDTGQPLLFTVSASFPDLVAAIKGNALSMPSPALDIKGSVAGDTISIDANARLSLTAANKDLSLKVPTIALQAATTRQGAEQVQVKGTLTLDSISFVHHTSGASGEDGHLKLPISWPLSDKNKKGDLSLTKIIWQEKELGALSGTVQLLEKKLAMTADFNSPLLQGLAVVLSLSSDISGETGSTELALSIPPVSLIDFSLARLFPQAKSISISGLISGESHLSLAGGSLKGTGQVSLKNGSLELPGKNITVTGIDTSLALPFLPQLRSAPNQKLNFASARIGELTIDGGSVNYTVESTDSFFLEKGNFNWADGSVNTYALRFAQQHLQPEMIFYCSKLKLAKILEQAGIKNVEGDGTVNGRIPVSLNEGKITFEPSFLYSTPGEGGVIRIKGGDFLTQAIPLDSPQFGQLDFAQAALRNFRYNWAKVHLFSEDETLVMQLNLDGKPASPLPFVYDAATGGLQRTHVEGAQGISQPILLDVNFRFPLNTILDYDKNLKDLLQRAR